MKWKLVTVGKPALAFARAGVDEYLKRLRRFAPVEWRTVKAGTPDKESAALLAASEGSSIRVALDERGERWDSPQLAKWIAEREIRGAKEIALLIGGADGHSDALRRAGDLTLSLSTFTLQHELALVVLLEQLYRAYTIHRGMPYHR